MPLLILINREIVKPDCTFKIDLEPFFFCSYAVCFHTNVISVFVLIKLAVKLQNQNFVTDSA